MTNHWEHYEKLIVHQLEQLSAGQAELSTRVTALTAEVIKLKTKSTIFIGTVAAVPGLLSLAIAIAQTSCY